MQAQFIDANGNANIYPDFFASTGRGFLNQMILAGQTLIYGVQCILDGMSDKAIPQNGTGWRGTVQIDSQNPGNLVATPTQRLLDLNPDPDNTTAVEEVVYAVPTASGGTII